MEDVGALELFYPEKTCGLPTASPVPSKGPPGSSFLRAGLEPPSVYPALLSQAQNTPTPFLDGPLSACARHPGKDEASFLCTPRPAGKALVPAGVQKDPHRRPTRLRPPPEEEELVPKCQKEPALVSGASQQVRHGGDRSTAGSQSVPASKAGSPAGPSAGRRRMEKRRN